LYGVSHSLPFLSLSLSGIGMREPQKGSKLCDERCRRRRRLLALEIVINQATDGNREQFCHFRILWCSSSFGPGVGSRQWQIPRVTETVLVVQIVIYAQISPDSEWNYTVPPARLPQHPSSNSRGCHNSALSTLFSGDSSGI
jgi:hypothetical protein